MDTSKILLIICGAILAVCLVFSVCALTVLRNAISEADQMRADAQELLDAFDASLKSGIMSVSEEVTDTVSDPDKPVNASTDGFCIRDWDGKIGIFTVDGYLIRLLDIPVDTLPEVDRIALRDGFTVDSWRELIALMQDFSA